MTEPNDKRDNKAAEEWFRATDQLLDSVIERCNELELFRLASPEERLVMMEAQMHWCVKEFFRPMHEQVSGANLTVEEQKAWMASLKETKELSSGGGPHTSTKERRRVRKGYSPAPKGDCRGVEERWKDDSLFG